MKLLTSASLALTLLVLPACGDDGGEKTTDDTTGSDTPATTTESTGDEATTTTATATEPTTTTDPTETDPTETPTTGTDPTGDGLSFEIDVWDPILSTSCSCHTAGAAGGLGLGNSAMAAYDAMVGVASTSGLAFVEAGNSNDSYLFHKVNGTQEDVGGSGGKMPQGGSLSDTDIATIAQWIDDGALP